MTSKISILENPWARSEQDIIDALDSPVEAGLDEVEVKKRRQKHGSNRLRQTQSRSAWDILVDQFKSMVVLLLVAAAGAAFAFGNWVDGSAIVIVVIINAAIGFFTELRATRSMEALRKLGHVQAKVRRSGQIKEVPAEALVPGDIVVLESGDIITADLRLREASKLQVNESALTGESIPVSKQVEPLADDTPLAERSNMLFKGTSVTRGSGEGVVVSTGMETELGQISSLVDEAEEEDTPLEKRLDQMGQKLVWITLAVAAVVSVLGILQNKDTFLMVETGIALAVAAIPEGLPIVATIALAQGMRRMAKRNALVNRLASVETLGGTNVICTDKTGTLTENQMTVTCFNLATGQVEVSGEGLERDGEFTKDGQTINPTDELNVQTALKVGVLCNNASLSDGSSGDSEAVGDPVEIALLVAGAKAGMHRNELLGDAPEEREEAFDPDLKMMATFHRANGYYQVAVKGAPEAILEVCTNILIDEDKTKVMTDDTRQEWSECNRAMAKEGLRVLALATKPVDLVESDPYTELTFLGLVGLLDPPRDEVRRAITACQKAGVRVVIVTGDQPITARNVGQSIGLVDAGTENRVIHGNTIKDPAKLSKEDREHILQAPILARVSPKQKLDLIDIHQSNGAVVAMTGDGVNDAPALKKADIGIAMGQRGTQVAQEAADMVLQDDAFGSIVAAIEQGRVIFNNIRKFVLYLHSGNGCKIITVALASLINAPLPILPLQILYLNVITDVFPALALGVSKGDSNIMQQPPRDPKEPILTRNHWLAIGGYGLLITVATLGALGLALIWLEMEQQRAVTVSFLTLAFAQLWHVFNLRDKDSGLLRNEIINNPFIWGALALCAILLLGAVYLPPLSSTLKVVDPGLHGWFLIIAMSFIPVTVGQILKLAGFDKL